MLALRPLSAAFDIRTAAQFQQSEGTETMDNLISRLTEIVKDPVELTSITLPSAALAAGLFAYREQIHPILKDLPDPLAGNQYGGVLFLVVTLTIALVVKILSHDVLNWTYDIAYRNRKRKRGTTFYSEAASLLADDPKLSKYDEAYKLVKVHEPTVVPKIDLLQIQSKLARSVSLILVFFAILLSVRFSWLLAMICVVFAFFMWYTFCRFRWDGSELVYKALREVKAKLREVKAKPA